MKEANLLGFRYKDRFKNVVQFVLHKFWHFASDCTIVVLDLIEIQLEFSAHHLGRLRMPTHAPSLAKEAKRDS